MPVPTTKPGVKPKPSAEGSPAWHLRVAALVIVFGVVLAYANSLSVPFVFDDIQGVVGNTSIRKLWPLTDVMFAISPDATGAVGRPVVNLSLALNYAIGGLDVRGYHAFNLLLHAMAALLLFGLVRRTLNRPVFQPDYSKVAFPLALATALLWALHPLLTESVTCVIQRTELLGGFFYLLTLYAFARSMDAANPVRWRILSVAAGLLGVASKEIVATAPLIVLLYDRTFAAGSFATAWRQRWRYYLGLAAIWIPLGLLVLANESRGGLVGFGLGVSSWDYALTQCRAILLYLKLAFWPHPLVMDYGADVVRNPGEVWLQGVLLLTLVAATFVALVRKPVVGFVAFTAFAILAPSSSFVPLTTQTIAEHRMYLPLAGVILLVLGAVVRRSGVYFLPGVLVVALLAGIATSRRNQDYRSVLSIWTDTAAKAPDNPRARSNLADNLVEAGRVEEALREYEQAIAIRPDYAHAEFNLANLYLKTNRFGPAVAHYQRTIALKPKHAQAHYALGYALLRTGRLDQAMDHYRQADELEPNNPVTLRSYASALGFAGRHAEALAVYQKLLRLAPADSGVQGEVGGLLAQMGQTNAALSHLRTALQLDAGNFQARYVLARLLLNQGDSRAALEQFGRLVTMKPDFAEGRNGLGMALQELERWPEAVEQFREALRLRPDYAEARDNLDRAELLRDLRAR